MFMLFLIYRAYIFILSLRGFFNLKEGNRVHLSQNTKLRNKYIFIFPAFKEKSIAQDTCEYYGEWLKKDENIEMIFVGDSNDNEKPNTVEIAQKYFDTSLWKNRFITLICVREKGSKASKVNFALDHIRKKYKHIPYVVVFDFDARLQWEDFLKSDELISHKNGHVYSFTPMIESTKQDGILLKSYLVHHLERVLANELGNSLMSPYVRYPMGASMILTPELWEFIKYIPEPIDDIPLGFLLAKKGAQCLTLPYFTRVRATLDMKGLYRQYIPIYTGMFSRVSTLQQFHVTTTQKDYVIELLCNMFTVAEYVAIIYSVVLLFDHNLSGIIVLYFQNVMNLIFLRKWSFTNSLYGLIGYYVRLTLFINFLLVKMFTRVELNTYKTLR